MLSTADPKLKTDVYAELGISVTCDAIRRVARIESRLENAWAKVGVGGPSSLPDWRVRPWR